MNKIFKDQKYVCYFLWGALTFANLVYAFIIVTGLMGPYTSSKQSHLFYPALSISILLGIGSVLFFKKITSTSNLSKILKSVDLINPPAASGAININAFNQLNEDERRKFYGFAKVYPQLVICWALCEFATILGLVAYNARMLQSGDQFWIFFSIGLGALFLCMPRFLDDFYSTNRGLY